MKLLSVIIPVYNVEKYLDQCIQSVLYPDESNYEIILVNDGSTDSSLEILERYRALYPKLVFVVNKPNGGLGSARNAGLSYSDSKYVIFPDSDDYLIPGALPEILQKCQDEFDICFYDADAVLENGTAIEHICGAGSSGTFSLESYPDIIFARANAWNKIYRRSLFSDNSIRFPGREWYEDISTIPKLYLHASRLEYLPVTWYCYRMRAGSIINSKNIERNLEIISAVDST